MYCSAESPVTVSGREDLLWFLAFLSYWVLRPPTWADFELLPALQLSLNIFSHLPSQSKCDLAWFIIRIIRCSHTKDRKRKNTRCGFLFLGTYDLPTVLRLINLGMDSGNTSYHSRTELHHCTVIHIGTVLCSIQNTLAHLACTYSL